ncbi:MAG: hypothetical protein JWQ32_904, partial [Marmoricola sp.]|nr:hypothetical protein [Marmoricola sp.]
GTGSIGAVTNSTNAVQATYAYEPFGVDRTSPTNQNSVTNPIRFASEYADTNTNRYNLRARDYDPATGRFNQLDPLAQDITNPYVSQYVYANNQPTVLLDPSGQCAKGFGLFCDAGGAIASVAGAVWNFDTTVGQYIPNPMGPGTVADQLNGIPQSIQYAGHMIAGCSHHNLVDCGQLFVITAATIATLGDAAGLLSTGTEAEALCAQAQAELRGTTLAANDGGWLATRLAMRNEQGAIGLGSRFTDDQQALIQLAKDAKRRGGLTMDEADALANWADELGLPGHGPAVHPGRPGFGGTTLHINIGPIKHIPVQ